MYLHSRAQVHIDLVNRVLPATPIWPVALMPVTLTETLTGPELPPVAPKALAPNGDEPNIYFRYFIFLSVWAKRAR